MNYNSIDEIKYNKRVISRFLSTYGPNPVCQTVAFPELVVIKSALKIDLPIESILYFQIPPGFIGKIHKDLNLDEPEMSYTCALNIPLHGCENVKMKWFEPREDSIEDIFPGPSALNSTPQLNAGREIDSVSMHEPIVVKIDNWHSIVNESTEYGSLISVRFQKHLLKEDVAKILTK